jgi:molybdopterin-containing oxidoreductase family membrane subunit
MNRRQQPDDCRPQEPLVSPARAGWGLYAAVLLLAAIVLAAAFAFGVQLREGIGVSGKNRPVIWSVYIANFVFWTGIGHGSILLLVWARWMKVSWMRAFARYADVFAFVALVVGSLFPILHLGRPWRFYWLTPIPKEGMLFPNFHAPLIWDFLGINTLLVGILAFLYFHLLPDCARIRDGSKGLRKILAAALALGWRGSDVQWRRLDRLRLFMTVLVGIMALAANLIQSRIFASTPNQIWKSPATTPYFLLTAVYSAIALSILLTAALGRGLLLQRQAAADALRMGGRFLLGFGFLWLCFTAAEMTRLWSRGDPAGLAVIASKLRGDYSPVFWSAVLCCFVLPAVFLGIVRRRPMGVTVLSAASALTGLWLDRFLFIVPALSHPRLAAAAPVYSPTWVEGAITAGAASGFALVCLLFARMSPLFSAWESSPRE